MQITIRNVLTPEQIKEFNEALSEVAFEDGRATAGVVARRVKNNQQTRGDDEAVAELRQILLKALQQCQPFQNFALPRRIMPPMFSRYEPGMNYGDHVDNAVMPGQQMTRSDLSMTIFLSDPESYEGGELMTDTDLAPQTVKLPAGGAVVYPSSTLHRVNPVTRGVRLAAVTWIQSLVRDHSQRQMIFELGKLAKWARDAAPDSRESLQLGKLRANLTRMWADV